MSEPSDRLDPLQSIEDETDEFYDDCITCGEHEYDSNGDICHACGFSENPEGEGE